MMHWVCIVGCFILQTVYVYVSVPGFIDSAAEEYLRVYNMLDKLVDLTRSTIKDPAALSDLDNLQKILKGSGGDYDAAQMIYY